MSSALTAMDSAITEFPKAAMLRAPRSDPELSGRFTTSLLARNIRIEEDPGDQLFNSSEKRLARILLLLANFGKEGGRSASFPQ